jgi:hypothetical protein
VTALCHNHDNLIEGVNTMQHTFLSVKLSLAKVDPRYIRLILAILSLATFVLAAGAPGATGGVGN